MSSMHHWMRKCTLENMLVLGPLPCEATKSPPLQVISCRVECPARVILDRGASKNTDLNHTPLQRGRLCTQTVLLQDTLGLASQENKVDQFYHTNFPVSEKIDKTIPRYVCSSLRAILCILRDIGGHKRGISQA